MTLKSPTDKIEKTAVTILSGFLGAGKTTLLKRMIGWQSRPGETVIIVNEFGNVGIDGALIGDSGSEVVELNSGCICCTLSADLSQSLTDLWNRFRPRRVLIESSGVADPASTLKVLQEPDLDHRMRLESIVTVLDADFWEAREMFGPLFYNQLEAAHLILLNKVDLVDKVHIPEFLEQLHELVPRARVVPTIQCRIDPETLWAVGRAPAVDLKPIQSFRKLQWDSDNTTGSARGFITFSFQDSGVLDEKGFDQFVDKLPKNVFRFKGTVRFADRTVMINYVGGKIETLPWNDTESTELAFIGWDIEGRQILDRLSQCVTGPS